MKKILLVVVAAVLALGAGFLIPTLWLKPWVADHFYARIFLEYALRHPMLLTELGILDGTVADFHSDDLDDLSIEAQRREARFVERNLGVLAQYDRRAMTPGQRLSRDVLGWFLENQRDGHPFMFHNYPVNQMSGIHTGLPEFLMRSHPLRKPRDAENYVRRVRALGRALDQVDQDLAHRESLGVVPPRFVLEKALAQLHTLADPAPREHPLFTHLAGRLDSIPKLDVAQRTRLLDQLAAALEASALPAYRRIIDRCEGQLARATTDDGVWKLPDGDAYYAWCLRNHTTTDLPADSLHALGMREIARIHDVMRDLLAGQGIRAEPVAPAVGAAFEEPRFAHPGGEDGKRQVLAEYDSILADAQERARALFNLQPRAALTVVPVPAFREQGAPGAYYQSPTIAGGRPGTFYVNLREPESIARPTMRTLAYHEGIPGHHFQQAVAQEMKGVAFFRKIIPFTAYAEGWALYAERLALEQGFHADAWDSLGALQAELFRAVRLVVDTGIHRKHWTREQAIAWMVLNTGMPEADVVAEIERYIVNPGQACAYKVGQLAILELRERARSRLGERFDLKKFHDVVLGNGALPLTLLEQVVEEWIAAETRAAGPGARS